MNKHIEKVKDKTKQVMSSAQNFVSDPTGNKEIKNSIENYNALFGEVLVGLHRDFTDLKTIYHEKIEKKHDDFVEKHNNILSKVQMIESSHKELSTKQSQMLTKWQKLEKRSELVLFLVIISLVISIALFIKSIL